TKPTFPVSLRYRASNETNGDAMDLRGLLGPCMSQGGCDQQTGYELPALHPNTSSARTSNVGGMVTPSALAVLRFIKSSNFVGCSMGRSAGFAPFGMASTYVAPRRFRSVRWGPWAISAPASASARNWCMDGS